MNFPPAKNSLSTCCPFTGGVGSLFLAGGGLHSSSLVAVVVEEEEEEEEKEAKGEGEEREKEEEEPMALSIALRPPTRHIVRISSQFLGTEKKIKEKKRK